MKMNNDPKTITDWGKLLHSWWAGDTPVGAVLMAIIMAVLKIAYTGGGGRKMLPEGLLCGVLTLTFGSVLEYLEWPKFVSFAIGSGIDFIGVDAFRALSERSQENLMTDSRGIRNNNPGNIRRGDNWQGLGAESKCTDKCFCQFTAPEYGIRAMIIILRHCQTKHGVKPLRQMINRWVPEAENDNKACVNTVARQTRIDADEMIKVNDSRVIIHLPEAIITHENGSQPYDFPTFVKAIESAG